MKDLLHRNPMELISSERTSRPISSIKTPQRRSPHRNPTAPITHHQACKISFDVQQRRRSRIMEKSSNPKKKRRICMDFGFSIGVVFAGLSFGRRRLAEVGLLSRHGLAEGVCEEL
ncbi:hypothetical protein CFP56_036413 [Quercus suber]|uniref:Uncharacterized protein n=1 Tax=Quercus suber TaxID=58331 RepID=A0AAW0LQK5_QUESU